MVFIRTGSVAGELPAELMKFQAIGESKSVRPRTLQAATVAVLYAAVGIALFMGGESTPSRAVVQSAGKGYRMPSQALKDEFKLAPVLHLLLR